ncbi:MAG: large ribosomal subunit protein uL5, partial [Phycisphaerales bacterium]
MSEKEAKKEHPKGEKPAGAKGGKPKVKHAQMETEGGASGPRTPPRLHVRYKEQVAPQLGEKFTLKNPMQRPKLTSIVLNVNMGRHLENNKLPANVKGTVLETILKVTGQKPVLIKAKKSVSNFKVREGAETSYMVTLRRDRMWHFLDRFINLACPRIKDFRGLKDKAFDRQGNYSCGLTEQGVFPEINMA